VPTSRDLWARLGGNRISFDVPREQFFDAVDGMLSDPRHDLSEIEHRIKAVKPGAADEADQGAAWLRPA
jgi:hypothetical protein